MTKEESNHRIILKTEWVDMDKLVLTNHKGDTYTTKSEELMDFILSSESENERMKAEIAKLPKLDKGDKIKLYGKETEVIGFNVSWNEGLFDYEIILLTEGRGDPFKRSLGSIEILPQPPKQ